jgi:hypothetical protein
MEYGIPTRPDFAGTFVLRRYGKESSTIRRVEKGLMDAKFCDALWLGRCQD